MKRFLILFILIVFVTVSCAGPNKVGWTKRNFRQDEFEKDRKECMQTLNNKSYSQTSGVLDDCLTRKGYEYQTPSESPPDKEKAKTTETVKTVGKVLLVIAVIGVAVPLLVVGLALAEPRGTFRH